MPLIECVNERGGHREAEMRLQAEGLKASEGTHCQAESRGET